MSRASAFLTMVSDVPGYTFSVLPRLPHNRQAEAFLSHPQTSTEPSQMPSKTVTSSHHQPPTQRRQLSTEKRAHTHLGIRDLGLKPLSTYQVGELYFLNFHELSFLNSRKGLTAQGDMRVMR